MILTRHHIMLWYFSCQSMFTIIHTVPLDSVSSIVFRSDSDVSMLVGQGTGESTKSDHSRYQEIVPQLVIKVDVRTRLIFDRIDIAAFQRVVIQFDKQRCPIAIWLGFAEGYSSLIFHIESPGYGDDVLEDGHGKMLIAHMRRHVKQCATGVGSICHLDDVESRVANVHDFLSVTVHICKSSGDTVKGYVGDALVTVVKVLTARARWAVLQLAKLHLLASLAGVTAWTLTPEIIPRYVTCAVVIAWTAYAHIV